MSKGKKRNKSKQQPSHIHNDVTRQPSSPSLPTQLSNTSSYSPSQPLNQPTNSKMVQPEQMSLTAHQHIQTYLGTRPLLDKNDLNAILRLSQHLRVFGLLSAAGYVNQSNAQGGEVRERTVPVWRSLLGQLINENNPPQARELMEQIKDMAQNQPTEYMATWRKSLTLRQYWNFWGRAYAQSESD